ncbi:Sterol uptake control protein [Paramyrothecium foliicola]|nr:Sterol uptake control protein [Paramyrothecium foliicola]
MTETRLGARRAHTKSRKGCDACKKRKVKCDERYPSCFNCTRRGIGCSFALKNPPPDSGPLASQSPLSSLGGSDPLRGTYPSGGQLDPSSERWWFGLELMHHYTNMTANTLALRPDMQYAWRITVPELAYKCQFLMHAILSVTALHKARLLPSQREMYLNASAHHQLAGLEGFRAALLDLNDDNWKECTCFASLVAASALASPSLTSLDADSAIAETLKVFGFIRGIKTVLQPYQTRLTSTTLSAFARGVWIVDEKDPSYRSPPFDHTQVPQGFAAALQQLGDYFELNIRSKKRTDYVEAVRLLEKSYYQVAHAGFQPEVGMLLFTFYGLPETLVGDIETLQPYALVYLLYLLVLMRVMESKFWFLQGWAGMMFDIVNQHIADDYAYVDIAEWPRQQYLRLSQY